MNEFKAVVEITGVTTALYNVREANGEFELKFKQGQRYKLKEVKNNHANYQEYRKFITV